MGLEQSASYVKKMVEQEDPFNSVSPEDMGNRRAKENEIINKRVRDGLKRAHAILATKRPGDKLIAYDLSEHPEAETCPVCRGKNLEHVRSDVIGNEAEHEYLCNDCNTRFADLFDLDYFGGTVIELGDLPMDEKVNEDDVFQGADPEEVEKRKGERRKNTKFYYYYFPTVLAGVGESMEQAWMDAVDNFGMDPGDPWGRTDITRVRIDPDTYDEIGEEEQVNTDNE